MEPLAMHLSVSSPLAKALELFLQALIDESCKETRLASQKKLTTGHVKATILKQDKFDFLRDLVAGKHKAQEQPPEENGRRKRLAL